MANVSTPEFLNMWSNLIQSLKLEYENTVQQNPDTDAVMECVCGVLVAIARLAECTPMCQWKGEIECNCPKHCRNHDESQPASEIEAAVWGPAWRLKEVWHDLTAVLTDSTAKGQTAKATITTSPSIKEFHEQERWKWKPTDNVDKRAKKPTISTMGDEQLPIAVEASSSHMELLHPTEVGGWP
jgi:hypothetical protein